MGNSDEKDAREEMTALAQAGEQEGAAALQDAGADDAGKTAGQEPEEESEKDLLRAILKQDRNEVKFARAAAFFTFGIFAVILVAVLILLPTVMKTLHNVNDAVDQVSETLDSAGEAIDQINDMTGSITRTSENMNGMISDNADTLTDAVKKIEDIDFEGLNQAIQDLQDAVGPFASFMNRFK